MQHREYDVWLFSWRSCPELEASRSRFTLDDVARHDWPAAVEVVRRRTNAAQVDCVVHCIGSQTLLMSLAAGYLEDRIRSAVCLQVGLHFDQPPLTRFKAFVRTAEALDLVGLRYLSQSARANGIGYRLLDAALVAYPVDRRQRCDNITCRRSTFIWGELVNHANISDATHARMSDFLGDASIHAITQMNRGIRRHRIVAADGRDIYFGALERLALPITFIHGSDNLTVCRGSTWNTYQALRGRNGPEGYRFHSIPGYGHMDCLVGRDAARCVSVHRRTPRPDNQPRQRPHGTRRAARPRRALAVAARALAAGCVDIWLTDPDAIDDPARLRAYEGLLGKDEYLRYRRYLAPKRRHDFLVSRALLRTSLSRYADVAPAAWRFDVNRFGKPLVRGTETNLRFSLSHTDGLIACAVTRGGDIGVDVEPLNRSVNMRAIARATFAPPGLERLECLTGTEQARFFFSIWTLKEAYVKAHGRGLTLALREFWFEVGGESIATRFAPGWDDLPGRWNFWQTVTRSGHVLSLALAGSAPADNRVRLEATVPDG